ncbi:MAG: nitroreductase family protein [Firmicutes bacterium]|nr:nitroreductase family protein [Bacillota bacterium]
MKLETPILIIIILLTICATLLAKAQFDKKGQAQAQTGEPAKAAVTSETPAASSSGSNPAIEVIMKRKSVREYTAQPVSKEDLDILIRAGMAAPTAGNKQPWEFVVITDRKTLDKLADQLEYAKMLKDAKAAIAVCGVPKLSFPGKDSEYWIQDCSAATENILLAAEAINLGAVWTGVHPVQERIEAVRSTLNLPSDIIPLNVIAIGHPTGKEKPKNKYKPERIHWEKY